MSDIIFIVGPNCGTNPLPFHEAEQALAAAGFEIRNPARHADDWDRIDYQRANLRDLAIADGIAWLPLYEQSCCARMIVNAAKAMRLPVRRVGDWVVTS